ncbi:Mediator of RNA polymerase II transcription subunit 16 [Gnomoniopsis sp. IMI 355080]|nr:Mediator of RNA polymerase II transcription subunit 16 [Gnomoniopsis sp. IMI 355080]
MPMMMEDHLDALGGALPSMDDDLFGDEVLPLGTRPPSKQLQKRVDDLRSRGCCRTLAYSKHGIIASISPDGTQVNLQCPRTNPSNGSWELGEAIPCSIIPRPLQGNPIVHLAWAPTAQPELAVIDAFGRVCFVSSGVHANKVAFMPRKWDADAQDDLHSIVGCYWLPVQVGPNKLNVVHGPAVRENEKFRLENSVLQPSGPIHPNTAKSALVCVTAGGILKLFFAQNTSQIQDIHQEMESIASSDDLITHAAICTERGKLLIVLATAAKQLKIIYAEINWGVAQPPQDKQIPGGSLPLRPSLKIEHVTTTNWLQPGLAGSHLDASMDQISHLEALSPVVDYKTKKITPAMILSVRLHLPTAESHFTMEYQSIIDSWDVVTDQPQALHPAFEQRGSKAGAAANPSPLILLRKRTPIIINKIIVSIDTVTHGKIICLGFSDGTVQYRDRMTMAEIYHEEHQSHIMTLQQAGFHFPEEKPSLQTSFSSNNCAFAQLCENGKVKWNCLQYPVAQIGLNKSDPLYEAVLFGLVMSFANATHQFANYDDLLAVTRPFVEKRPNFLQDLVSALVFMMLWNIDYSEETMHDQLVRSTHWLFIMSIVNHFGFKGGFRPRSFNGKFAMLSLNARNFIILVTLANNSPMGPTGKISPMDEPEVVELLAGCAQWAVDLLSHVTDSLFCLRDDPKLMEILRDPRSFIEMTKYLKGKNEVAVHLILCSTTRCFLAAICRRITHLQSVCSRASEYWGSVSDRPDRNATPASRALQRAYIKLQRATTTKLVKIDEFEKLLSVVGEGVRQTYKSTLATLQQKHQQQHQNQPPRPGQPTPEQALKKAQSNCELNILLGEQPPPSFQPLVKKFFEMDLKSIMTSTNRFDLFFTDFPLLEVEDDIKRLAMRKADAKYVDVFKRKEFVAPELVKVHAINGDESKQHQQAGEEVDAASLGQPAFRRCVRCCAVMEEVTSPKMKPGYNFVMAQQRKCACGGSWASLP